MKATLVTHSFLRQVFPESGRVRETGREYGSSRSRPHGAHSVVRSSDRTHLGVPVLLWGPCVCAPHGR